MLPRFKFLVKLKNHPALEIVAQSNDPQCAAFVAVSAAQYRLGSSQPVENLNYLGLETQK